MNFAVLMGGISAEREISLKSGAAVTEALRAAGSQVCQIDPANPNWMEYLEGVDFVFIALHGPYGEDGRVQGMLELNNIPYSGSGVLGSALGMDKLRAKQLWRGVGVITPDFRHLDMSANFEKVIEDLGSVFVKPINEGSSVGMAIARTPNELREATVEASKFGSGVFAESLIEGVEYTVSILGEEVLPTISIETKNSFYDYDAKYISSDTSYHCPCGLNEPDLLLLKKLAKRAFKVLDCSVWGRVDVIRNHTGDFFFLEVNTVPGMTNHSLVPMAAIAANISMENLVQRIVNLSLEERC